MSGRFKPRPTRFVGINPLKGWRLKQYEITVDSNIMPTDVLQSLDLLLVQQLPKPASNDVGVGFLIVHFGAESVWALADLWMGDIIHQHTFSASLDDPTAFAPVPAGGPTACVWELPIHGFERDSFVTHVLDPADGPDLDAYLADVYVEAPKVKACPSNRQLLDDFAEAWSRGDVDGLMDLMSDEPTYRASTGSGPGTDYVGRDQVRAGFVAVIEAEVSSGVPAPPVSDIHVFDDRGILFWSYAATAPSGEEVMVEGVDVWTFTDGRITMKDAYRKAFDG